MRYCYSSFFFALLLGCTGAGPCSLCYDESLPPSEYLSFVPAGLGGLTCADVLTLGILAGPDESCDGYFYAGIQCGCPLPPGGCSFCADGSRPPDFELEVEGDPCGVYFSGAGSGEYACSEFTAVAELCGCPTGTATTDAPVASPVDVEPPTDPNEPAPLDVEAPIPSPVDGQPAAPPSAPSAAAACGSKYLTAIIATVVLALLCSPL
ncbi:hypothetical protein FisN_11Lu264 [Fistulifera solaris]|uniref:Uncharacterized protein n=1 Tax=Fistulifera solaris TaxID=1519565 RepID=A0A1Z5J702_FISSO|nr:hypothetical protein FisN_11Lu264 [Fistulifera solaris]|eukprot:GAX09777.1 hypothetical protein FisN_11Lu264 [Fistulifera solaris]